jgi:hypothetical protein
LAGTAIFAMGAFAVFAGVRWMDQTGEPAKTR